ncbi:uncharacterized protein STEHIDRAFT_117891 [Stereum hirsutum FP-91666 SS1]|uniref:uncharacterized protein n=1 Tax=Stereum hirsutum (strain FP-91666) TaxID=721885 RepID=UPI000440EECF|nr:uncharacterized protein STEHIDRAFT_117891 [Stereum hirsutum FP-91666 SS1]EIM92971.1 hypothetical protein STEHIDRAFT_117891 [Stereum hirsutum FP-91666 SS1]
MPVPGFLSSFADKAQSAINSTPLAQHIPGARPVTPNTSGGASGDASGNTGGAKNHTLEQLQHHFRTFQQQYTSTSTPVQRIVTTGKGVALDFETVNRDAQANSKELYTWGQGDAPDVRDISDRLAFINFVSGSLSNGLALKLDAARAPFKQLRDKETALAPRRTARAGLQSQIGRIEAGQEKGYEKRLVDLRAQLTKAERDDEAAEREFEILKRKALKESERLKWEAFREYGEKLSLLSQASESILTHLPSVPGSYNSTEETGAIRATLQHALDHWKPGQVTLSASEGANLDRSHTRSFGETHARELAHINPTQPSPTTLPVTPPPTSMTFADAKSTETVTTAKSPSLDGVHVPAPVPLQTSALSSSPSNPGSNNKISPIAIPSAGPRSSQPKSSAINTATLNTAPANIPNSASPPAGGVLSPKDTVDPTSTDAVTVPSVTPTVAETGIPVAASPNGPGPSSGSLRDLKPSSPTGQAHRDSTSSMSSISAVTHGGAALPTLSEETRTPAGGLIGDAQPKFESAEEEKKKLQREERERLLHEESSSAGPPPFESAEEEKKRLEREEREKILHAAGGPNPDVGKPGDDGPPPYQDF